MKINKSYNPFALCCFLFLCAPGHVQALVKNLRTGNTYSTIQAAINDVATISGDNIQIPAGIYPENVTVKKSITLSGSGSATIITPYTGTGITITSSGVTITSLRITGASAFGIYASGISTLVLNSVVCDVDNIGAQLNTVSGVTVSGCTFSNNNDYGFFCNSGQSYSVSSSVADGNGKTVATGSGMKFHGLTGSSTLTNITADNNHCHGVELGGVATSNITINGGEFNGNGSSNLTDGGGIYIYARSATVSTIAINGPLVANNNITCGIYLDASTSSSDIINGLTIGQSGTASFSNNGTSKGAGVLLFGNILNVTITGNFSKGSVTNAGGVIIVGQNSSGYCSPQNVSIANSIFHAGTGGYNNLNPAIGLADGQPSHNYISINNATAAGNTFLGLTTLADIPTVIYDKNHDASLGLVTLIGNMLPVEMVSFKAEALGNGVQLQWSTATEVNNYGFEVERRTISDQPSAISTWQMLGFVKGNGTSNVPQSYRFSDATVSSGTYGYRLKQIDNDGAFKYSFEAQVTIAVPTTFALYQNYPNPFNPTTTIEFAVPEQEKVSLVVYNLLGQKVGTIFNEEPEAGVHYKVIFDAESLPSGIYMYQLDNGQSRIIRKMLLLK
jgi:Secretion system C-terminal sorting domain/Right handed beta helix region